MSKRKRDLDIPDKKTAIHVEYSRKKVRNSFPGNMAVSFIMPQSFPGNMVLVWSHLYTFFLYKLPLMTNDLTELPLLV